MVTLRQLEVFAEVVRAGSVTHAAARLYVSQPSVSDTVAALERDIGERFFTGRGKARKLTDAGEMYWGYTRRILDLFAEARQSVLDLQDGLRGRLTLLAVTTAGEHLVPPALGAFSQKYPDVEVSLVVANRAEARIPLNEATVDLAIMGRPPLGVAVEIQPIAVNMLHLLCSPHDPIAIAPSIDKLTNATWLVREVGSGTRTATEEIAGAFDIGIARTMVLGSNAAILSAVKHSLGVCVLPDVAVRADLDAGDLVSLEIGGFPAPRTWHAVWPSQQPLTRPASAFLDELMRVVSTDK